MAFFESGIVAGQVFKGLTGVFEFQDVAMNEIGKPLVTIAIPTYNRAERFLANAINCALRQTYRNLEILISDNCSTDNTEQVVRAFTDSRIRYIKQSVNLGANGNFNYCINNAAGEYIHLLLDDDEIDPDFIESCLAAVGDRDVGLIRTGTRLIDDEGTVLMQRENPGNGLSDVEFFLAWFHNKLTLYVCSTVFKTDKLRAVGGFGSLHNLFQDVMAEARVIVRYGRVDLSEVKASFRLHDSNMGSAAKISAWCEDSQQFLDILCDLLPAHREVLVSEGKIFLSKMNLELAAGVRPLFRRLHGYRIVGSNFGFPMNPFTYLYRKELKPLLKKIVRSR